MLIFIVYSCNPICFSAQKQIDKKMTQITLIGFFMLNFIYLKFLIIWRSACAIACMDGLETVDNMNRCVCNNYTFAGFWRSWHRSLHVWILKYMYWPMGGHKRRLVIVWPIFIFIGVSHALLQAPVPSLWRNDRSSSRTVA